MFSSLGFAPVQADGPRRPYFARWLVQLSAVVVVLIASCAPISSGGRAFDSVAAVLLVGACLVAVLWRETYPRTALGVSVCLYCLGLSADGPIVGLVVAMLIAMFALSKSTDRRCAVLAAVAASVTSSSASLYFVPGGEFGDGVVQLAALIGFAAAAGDASRSRETYLDSMTERARAAEETKEAEAMRRVSQERLRIARDLHDALAHQIAVINMHANVATQALPERPPDAEAALAVIRQAARAVLGEMGSLLTVLRTSDERDILLPVPGMSDLSGMIASFEQHGLVVEVRCKGSPRPLAVAVDIVAYRVVQEGLTNALKHGADGTALLYIEVEDDGIRLTVTNASHDTPPKRGPLSGHGLIGALERAASVGGTLTARPGPVYRFTAWLPDVATPGARK